MIGSDELVEMLADPTSKLTITPLIDAGEQIGEGSVDIRLGPDIIVSPRATGAVTFDPMDRMAFKHTLEQRQEYIRRGIGDPFPLQPGEFVIARSLEYVTLPDDVAAEALGRSSWGRLGLVIATATLIQPGFKGTITLELANVGDTPIMLEVGLSIAQLVFSREERPFRGLPSLRRRAEAERGSNGTTAQPPPLDRRERRRVKQWRARHRRLNDKSGRYKLQIKPEHSLLYKDKDLIWLTPMAIRYAVGVLGERFAGQAAVVDFLVSRRHFRLYRLSHFVYEEARRRGEDPTDRVTLRRIGEEMRRKDGDAILAQLAFERIRSDLLDPDCGRQLERIVIDGFRHQAELEVWQKLDLFRPIVVKASLRRRRLRAERDAKDELDGYPERGTDLDARRDAWFEENVDATSWAGWRSARNPLTVVNDFDTESELHGHLKIRMSELEREWRAREY